MAGRPCTVCQHPQRAEIDKALVAGRPFLALAREYGLDRFALKRHKEAHLAPVLVAAQRAKDSVQAEDLLSQVQRILDRALKILDKAEAARDYKTALQSIREARGCIELLAELTQQLDRRPVVNILLTPEWWRVKAAMLEALEPFPEARVAVAERLWELEDGRGNGIG